MRISLKFHKLDSVNWDKAPVYTIQLGGKPPEIYAMRLKYAHNAPCVV